MHRWQTIFSELGTHRYGSTDYTEQNKVFHKAVIIVNKVISWLNKSTKNEDTNQTKILFYLRLEDSTTVIAEIFNSDIH